MRPVRRDLRWVVAGKPGGLMGESWTGRGRASMRLMELMVSG